MPRKIIQDVVPSKSIRNIPLPKRRLPEDEPITKKENRSNAEGRVIQIKKVSSAEDSYIPEEKPRQKFSNPLKQGKKALLVAIAVAAVILFFTFSYAFSGAEISITPVSRNIDINENISIKKEGVADLSYGVITISKSITKTIPADFERKVEQRAKGTIIIYNNFSKSAQKLIKNTRFQNADGLIYKIDKSVEVPGYTVKGSTKTAGSIEATVYAESPGKEYNTDRSDFTLPGLKSDPERFKTIFARSKTAMSGGDAGIIKSAKPETINALRTELQKTLLDDLIKSAKAKTPDDSIFYDESYFIVYKSVEAPQGSEIAMTEEASISAMIFKKAELAKSLALRVMNDYEGAPIEILEPEKLNFVLKTAHDANDWPSKRLDASISGKAIFVWKYDENKIRQELAGKRKSAINEVLSAYPNIDKGKAVIRPIWKGTFPTNGKKIRVVNTLDSLITKTRDK